MRERERKSDDERWHEVVLVVLDWIVLCHDFVEVANDFQQEQRLEEV